MYKHYQKTQQNECLICFEPLLKNVSFAYLLKSMPICHCCMKKFVILQRRISFHHHSLTILYEYNDFFRTLLYQYKGLYDYALKDVFLCLFSIELQTIYQGWIIAVAPSSKEDNLKRGFAPMEEIAKTLNLPIFTGLYKKEKYKQSDLSYKERLKVKEKIGIYHQEQLRGKKVLILDDVITSGSTLTTCIDLILSCSPQKIEVLILSSKNAGY